MSNAQPFVIERILNAPTARVWKAITSKEEMKKWYFDLHDFKPEIGNEFTFTGSDGPVEFVHLCKITELVPGKRLTYSWSYKGYEGMSFVTFELFSEGNKTRLKLTHEGLETFPQNNPSFRRESFAGGWTEIIGKLLPEFLEKEPVA